MNKIILTTFYFSILNAFVIIGQTNIAGQAKLLPQFSICNSKDNHDTINHLDFDQCLELIPNNKNLKIKSYVISVFIEGQKGESGVYADYTVEGSKIEGFFLEKIKSIVEQKKAQKITIKDILVLDGNKEEKYNTHLVLFVK